MEGDGEGKRGILFVDAVSKSTFPRLNCSNIESFLLWSELDFVCWLLDFLFRFWLPDMADEESILLLPCFIRPSVVSLCFGACSAEAIR